MDSKSDARDGKQHPQLPWTQLDNDRIVYNIQSGETHFLNEMAFETLNLVRSGCTDLNAVTSGISASFDVPNELDLQTEIKTLIREFDDLGLIEPFQP